MRKFILPFVLLVLLALPCCGAKFSENVVYSDNIREVSHARQLAAVQRVVAVYDLVFDLPKGSRPVTVYAFDMGNPSLHGLYDPLGAVLTVNTTSDMPDFTLVHEFAHYIDNEILTQGGALTTGTREPEKCGLKDWLQAMRESQRCRDLTAFGALFADDAGVKKASEYYTSAPEMWARSVTQWLTVRSNDSVLLEQMQARQHMWVAGIWADSDFKATSAQIDKYFAAKGWLRKQGEK